MQSSFCIGNLKNLSYSVNQRSTQQQGRCSHQQGINERNPATSFLVPSCFRAAVRYQLFWWKKKIPSSINLNRENPIGLSRVTLLSWSWIQSHWQSKLLILSKFFHLILNLYKRNIWYKEIVKCFKFGIHEEKLYMYLLRQYYDAYV